MAFSLGITIAISLENKGVTIRKLIILQYILFEEE